MIEYLMQTCRPYIYTTAPPPALAVATCHAINLVESERWRAEYLQTLIMRFQRGAEQLGLNPRRSITPIQPLIIGDPLRAAEISDLLLKRGIYVAAIRPPTVPRGTARLRISLTAAHTEDQVDHLLTALSEVI
jgi:7-keto-8-aminopelargonate synthetase and related enzymes